jgi:hypothetical protein
LIETEAASEHFPKRLWANDVLPIKRSGCVFLAGGREMRCLLLTLLLILPVACEEVRVNMAFCSNTCGDLCRECHEGSASMRSRCESFCEASCGLHACISISGNTACEDVFEKSCDGDF